MKIQLKDITLQGSQNLKFIINLKNGKHLDEVGFLECKINYKSKSIKLLNLYIHTFVREQGIAKETIKYLLQEFYTVQGICGKKDIMFLHNCGARFDDTIVMRCKNNLLDDNVIFGYEYKITRNSLLDYSKLEFVS